MVGKTTAQPSVKAPPICVWCKTSKETLKYVLPTQNGKKEFCTEVCLADFRRAYSKGACTNCDTPLHANNQKNSVQQQIKLEDASSKSFKEFCSPECLTVYQKNLQQQKGVSKKSGSHQFYTNPVENLAFDWEQYLKETKSIAAPRGFFRQHAMPPENRFRIGVKLEAIDPRNTTSTCIATVIGFIGPRLRLRLDGSDSSNDFWRIVDSSDIQPIGTTEKNHGMLQPPLGFTKNASNWPNFLLKTLNGAEMAAADCFISEPPEVRFNFFKAGMKLEAVDRKNPHLICVASVGGVNADLILVRFDGFNGGFDYWTRFDAREIFPVGWCREAGHPLQPPGNGGKLKGSGTGLYVPPPPLPVTATALSSTPTNQSHHHHSSSPQQSTPTSSTPTNKGSQPDAPPISLHLTPHLCCDLGHLDPTKLQSIPTLIGPSATNEVLNQFVIILKQILTRGSTISFRHYETPLEPGDFWLEIVALMRICGCCDGLVRSGKEEEEELDEGFDPHKRNGGRRCGGTCTKLGVNNPTNNSTTGSSAGSDTTTNGKLLVSPLPPPVCKPDQSKGPPKELLETNGMSSNSNGDREQKTLKRSHIDHNIPKEQSHEKKRKKDPSEWTVDDVIRYICDQDEGMRGHADVFKKHEIDGKAMMLLNSDVMMKYMGLKLGPALKICNIVGKLLGSTKSK